MDSLLQIIEVLLIGLVGDDDLSAWQDHLNILDLLRADSHAEADMRRLQELIPRWKSKIFTLFNNISESAQPTPTSTAAPPPRQASDQSDNNPTPQRSRELRTLNLLNIPNFKTISHVPEQIHFLGPMWFQDTMLFEQRHLQAKQLCLVTNQQSNKRNVLFKVHFSLNILFSLCHFSHSTTVCMISDP
jgi:hypothetical protein